MILEIFGNYKRNMALIESRGYTNERNISKLSLTDILSGAKRSSSAAMVAPDKNKIE